MTEQGHTDQGHGGIQDPREPGVPAHRASWVEDHRGSGVDRSTDLRHTMLVPSPGDPAPADGEDV